MANILIYSEKTTLARELITCAALIDEQDISSLWALSVNNTSQGEELACLGLKVLNVEAPTVRNGDTAAMGVVIARAANQLGPELILLGSDRRGKELAGRVAEALGAGCLTDVKNVQIENGSLLWSRNALNGATVATQIILTPLQVVAITPRSYPMWDKAGAGQLESLALDIPASVEVVEIKNRGGDQTDIQAAARLVAVGQGLENQADLDLVARIASALKAEIACSKPVATDRKWLPEDRIIGLSGKICKPELVITLGISGQVQFMVGIRDSKTIISINKDENADLNKMSDYYFVADLDDVLPELAKILE